MSEEKMKIPKCRECGLCCTGFREDRYGIQIEKEDYGRLSYGAKLKVTMTRWNVIDEGGWTYWLQFLHQRVNGVHPCIFLRGTPGRRVSCRIYKNRPGICRQYKRGGPDCRLLLREHALRISMQQKKDDGLD